MKILVTGAAGRLGSRTVAALLEAGHEVLATDIRWPERCLCDFRVANLLQTESVYPLFEGAEAVVHLGNHPNAGSSTPQRVYSENAAMNANIFQAALDVRTPQVIFASTIQAVTTGVMADGTTPRPLAYLPYDSRMPHSPGNAYAASKAAAENLLAMCADLGLPSASAVRFPWIVSPQYSSWLRRSGAREARGTIAFSEFLYLAIGDAAEFVAALVRARPAGFRTFLPACGEPVVNLPLGEIRERYFPGVPVRGGELLSLVDLSEVTEATGWRPRRRLEDGGDL